MANTKISGASATTAPLTTDELPLNQGGASKKITLANLKKAMPGYEFAYDALTTTVTSTQTVQASATTVLAGTATTYDGAAVMVEIGAVVQISDPGTLYMTLWKDGVDTARVQQFNHSGATAGSAAFRSSWRDTPSAGSHTYALKVFVSAGTGTVYGSATASMAPAFIRVVKV
jgi:hypothetical protein